MAALTSYEPSTVTIGRQLDKALSAYVDRFHRNPNSDVGWHNFYILCLREGVPKGDALVIYAAATHSKRKTAQPQLLKTYLEAYKEWAADENDEDLEEDTFDGVSQLPLGLEVTEALLPKTKVPAKKPASEVKRVSPKLSNAQIARYVKHPSEDDTDDWDEVEESARVSSGSRLHKAFLKTNGVKKISGPTKISSSAVKSGLSSPGKVKPPVIESDSD